MEDKPENFEDQLDKIDELSTQVLEAPSEPSEPPKKPKLSRGETKSAILTAIKKKQISQIQGRRLLSTLGFDNNNKKQVSTQNRIKKRKQQKNARKANRK